jgi:hypothetical protein
MLLVAARTATAQLPDLTIEGFDISLQQGASVDPGDVVEGCASGASGRTLLRFALRTRNIGTADAVLGDPGCPDCTQFPGAACTNPLYVCSTAHGHAHFGGYAKAELIAPDNAVAAVGRKIGFCVLDLECPTAVPQYSCSYQGITAGCADVYLAELPCQYIDLTGVPLSPGAYTLRLTVDPDGHIAEADETNNTIDIPLTLDCDSGRDVLAACTPNPFLCYGTSVRGKAERRLPSTDVDASGTFGDVPLAVTRPREMCTPAGIGSTPRSDPTTHLRNYAARSRDDGPFDGATERVRLVTQLGELMLDVGRLDSYAVPASTAPDGEPVVLDPAQNTVDSFTCFKVKVPREFRAAVRATNLLVSGEFVDPPAFLSFKKPRRLCSPAATAAASMRTPTRHLLCYDVGAAPSARIRGEHVRDAFASRTVDLGRPREACLLAAKNPPHPLAEDLTPCGFQDVWQFQAGAGQSVEVRVDTTDAATAADLCAELTCGELQVTGDDDVPCTFPPPSYACPRITGIPTTDGDCFVSVHMCSTCANPDRAAYSLVVGVAGEEANPQLITDDSPPPP